MLLHWCILFDGSQQDLVTHLETIRRESHLRSHAILELRRRPYRDLDGQRLWDGCPRGYGPVLGTYWRIGIGCPPVYLRFRQYSDGQWFGDGEWRSPHPKEPRIPLHLLLARVAMVFCSIDLTPFRLLDIELPDNRPPLDLSFLPELESIKTHSS